MNKLPVVAMPTISAGAENLKGDNNVCKVGATYQQRKSMQSMYSDLFKALLRLPDKQVQQRVLDAINGVQVYKCPKCSYTFQNPEVVPQTENNSPILNIKEKLPLTLKGELGFRPKSIIYGGNITFSANPIKIIGNLKRMPLADAKISPLIKSKMIKLDENAEPKQFIKPVPIEKLMDKSRLAINSSTENGTKCNLTSTLKTEKEEDILEATKEISDEMNNADINAVSEDCGSKRKRKRKERVPQVIKKSHALLAQSKMVPKLKKHKINLEKVKASNQPNSVDNFDMLEMPFITDVLTLHNENSNSSNTSQIDHIQKTMKQQFLSLETMTDGMLPIHQAVCNNNEFLLKQHIFLWTKFKQVDLNLLYTEDDEDLLQLAIIWNSIPEILQTLISNNVDVQDLRENSNTVIHLAILNELDIQSFILLMENINLQLLSKLNDDGLSPLHLALRSNQFSYAEIMLNTVDKRLMGCVKYCRSSDSKKVDPVDYYISMCEQIDEKYMQESLKHSAKTALLNAREMMTGNTALFYAVGKNMENFIYFLLAHASNPNVQNYSGQDPRSFLGDHGKLLSISLKVDRTMEKLSKVIKKYHK